MNIDNLLIDWW